MSFIVTSIRGDTVILGILSDTHGLLRPEAISALGGSDLILHAGDVGKPEVLAQLERIAPTIAVRGNNDRGSWALELEEARRIEVRETFVYLLHDLGDLAIDPEATGIGIVVSGHSHKPKAELRNDVLYLNPGSAGPRRFRLPVTLARVRLDGAGIAHEIIDLVGADR